MSEITSFRSVGNLGAEVTSFVGRRREATEVKRLLGASRLATLTGVGGVGKTRLALRVAADMRRDFPDGTWFVDLAPLEDEGLISQTVAAALELQDRGTGWSVSLVSNFLSNKKLLLVLDNCEHLRDGCAVLVDTLLRQAPDLRVLVTSRQTLGLTGEHAFPVTPLSLPDETTDVGVQTVAHYEAVTLFVERATAVRSGFELTEDNVRAVSAVCRRLDGVPLAIELAAARLSALSVHDLVERLENRFQLLTGGSKAALPRHQTLRELIGWSWDLCSDKERTLWARVSVFASDFDLRSAESVCPGGVLDDHSILDLLSALVEKSIVTVHEIAGIVRYRMLDTLRQYGQAQLSEAGEVHSLRERHRRFYRDLVSLARNDWFSARQKEWLDRLRPEHGNVRVALDASFADPDLVDSGLEMVSDLWLFWIATGRISEARVWLDRGLRASTAPTTARTRALETRAYLCIMQEDLVTARSLLDEAKALAAVQADPTNVARAIELAALADLSEGDMAGAAPLLEEALAAQRESDDLLGMLDSSFCLACVKALEGDLTTAERVCREGIATCDEHGETWAKSYMLWCLGFVAQQRERPDEAVVHARDALRLAQSLDEPWAIACSFELLAWAAADDDAETAARLLGAAEGIWGRTGVRLFGIDDLSRYHDRCLELLRQRLGDDHLTGAMSEGSAMAMDEAVVHALGERPSKPPASGTPPQLLPPLTKRESEVAGLVARGLTNKEIASRLVISQRTAEAHVERILNKLGYTSRAQVAAWVVEQRGNVVS